jgi:hypothetical protein
MGGEEMRGLITGAAMLLSTAAHAGWQEKAIQEIKAEPKVVEASFQNGGRVLWVSMQDDGSTRDGFATYLCLLLAGAGRPDDQGVTVRILDAAAMRDELRQIGEGRCG